MPPVKPMLAKVAHDLPTGEGLIFEPKWDGFRCHRGCTTAPRPPTGRGQRCRSDAEHLAL